MCPVILQYFSRVEDNSDVVISEIRKNFKKIIGSVYTTNVYCERWVDKYLLHNLVSFISKTFLNYVSVVMGNKYCRDILYIYIVVERLFKYRSSCQNKGHVCSRNNIWSKVIYFIIFSKFILLHKITMYNYFIYQFILL